MKKKNGFTLLELLVVVLIIGILAAIALPQYKMVVGKAKFSTLKNITNTLQQSIERYYLAHSTWPSKYEDLDVEIKGNVTYSESSYSFFIYPPHILNCSINYQYGRAICRNNIAKVVMYYGFSGGINSKRFCQAYSSDINDIPHRLCENETGKATNEAECATNFCSYYY